MNKLETRSEVCYFVDYLKVTYDSREQKEFVSTNSIFLEDDYIMNHKPRERIVLEEVRGEPLDSPIVNNNTEQENTTSLPISAPVPR